MPKPDTLFQRACELIAEKGWDNFELKDLAGGEMTLADVFEAFPSRTNLLYALSRHIDHRTLSHLDPFDATETSKDRLFSVMMTRFDALAEYKLVIKALWKDAWKDPITLLESLPVGLNSMSWILQASGIDTTGIRGALRTKAFAICYIASVNTWLGDDTPDMDETMAALDKNLQMLNNFPGFFS